LRCMRKLEQEIIKQCSDIGQKSHLKKKELEAEKRRVANFVEFIAEGRTSRAISEALRASEEKMEHLKIELEAFNHSQEAVFKAPPIEWIHERISNLQRFLEQRTPRCAMILRKLLGKIRLVPTRGDIGRPYYIALSKLNPLSILDQESEKAVTSNSGSTQTPLISGSNSFQWWRRR